MHIKSRIEGNDCLDDVLREASKSVLPLDEKELFILQNLNEQGHANITTLGKINPAYCTRFTVSRRISHLVDQGFVRVVSSEEFKNTGKMQSQYVLTLKGALGILQKTMFDDIKMINDYYAELQVVTKLDPMLFDLAKLYAKYHIAFELLWAKLNKFNYREINLSGLFFEETLQKHIQFGILYELTICASDEVPQEQSQKHIQFGSLDESTDMEDCPYTNVLKKYGLLRLIIWQLIKKYHTNMTHSQEIKHVLDAIKREGRNPSKEFLLRYLLTEWGQYLELRFPHKPMEFVYIEYTKHKKLYSIPTIDFDSSIYDDICNELGLRRIERPLSPYFDIK